MRASKNTNSKEQVKTKYYEILNTKTENTESKLPVTSDKSEAVGVRSGISRSIESVGSVKQVVF